MIELLKIFEYFILFLLLGLSVWSISVMIDRRRLLKELTGDYSVQEFRRSAESGNLSALLASAYGKKGFWAEWAQSIGAISVAKPDAGREEKIESLDRQTRSFLSDKKIHLEKGLTVLATLGSNAPFIGLLGTVLGIIAAFASLSGSDPGSSSAVMTGISRALIATAAGLFVAIPAVVAYNYFQKKIRVVFLETESLKDFLASRL